MSQTLKFTLIFFCVLLYYLLLKYPDFILIFNVMSLFQVFRLNVIHLKFMNQVSFRKVEALKKKQEDKEIF